jgi:hypothetical protein
MGTDPVCETFSLVVRLLDDGQSPKKEVTTSEHEL